MKDNLLSKTDNWLSKTEYENIYSKVPRLCVDILTKSNNRVFLGKRKKGTYLGYYGLPGGRVRFGESLESALRRVSEKELGLNIKRYKMFNSMEFLEEINDKNIHSVSISYIVEFDKVIESSNDINSSEFDDVKHNHEVDETLIIPQHLKTINEYLEFALNKSPENIFR